MKIIINKKQYNLLLEGEKSESILIVGDSHSLDVGFTWSSLIKKSRNNVKIIAVGGMSTRWMKEQLKNELSKNNYDKVIIWGGTNDAFSMITNSEVISNLQQMVDMVNKQGGTAYVITGYDQRIFSEPGKLKSKYVSTKVMDEKRLKFIELQKMIPSSISNAVIIPVFDIDSSYTSDQVHGNSKAHSKVSDIVSGYLDKGSKSTNTNNDEEEMGGEKILDRIKNYLSSNKEFEKRKRPIPYESEVEDLQTALQFLGFSLPKWGVDGKFGPETERAVESFQEKMNMDVNGKIDKVTLEKIISSLLEKDFESSDLNKIVKTKSESLANTEWGDITIENSGINVYQYPSDLMDRFKNVVGDYYGTFISDCNSIGLNPLVAVRQLHTESIGFRKDVLNCSTKSPAGAMGLAQFMPGTWKSYGGGGDPCNVKDALKAYIKLMGDLLERFPGRVDLALSAYNAGPNRQDLKNAMKNDLSFTSLKGRIPNETYRYTSTILQV